MQSAHSVQNYVMNTLLYLCTIKEKYITVCNEFITQLCICEGRKNISKRIFTNFSYNPIQITGNYKFGKRNPNQKQPRL